MLTFSSTYKASLQSQLNAHMSGVTKTVMNSPCIDCQTGKDVNRVLSDMKGGNAGYQNRRGSNGRGRGRYNNNRRRGNSYNDRSNSRYNKNRGKSSYRGNQRENTPRSDNSGGNSGSSNSKPTTGKTSNHRVYLIFYFRPFLLRNAWTRQSRLESLFCQ